MKRSMSRAGLVVGLLALVLQIVPPWQGYPKVASAAEGDEVYELTWNVSTEDYGVQVDPHQRCTVRNERAQWEGNGVVRFGFAPDGSPTRQVTKYRETVSDEFDQVITTPLFSTFTGEVNCVVTIHHRWSIANPIGRPVSDTLMAFNPEPLADGTWIIREPLPAPGLYYYNRTDSTTDTPVGDPLPFCEASTDLIDLSDWSYWYWVIYAQARAGRPLTLVSDASGESFSFSGVFARANDLGGTTKSTVDVTAKRCPSSQAPAKFTVRPENARSATAALVCDRAQSCRGGLTVTPDKTSIAPDGQTNVQIRATDCGLVPVADAPVEVSLNVKAKSGGHLHDEANRPRGYLDGKKITRDRPSITVRTDAQGLAVVTFEPGKDLVDQSRGIAGTYNITAKTARLPGRDGKATIEVQKEGFVPLLEYDIQNWDVRRNDAAIHPYGTWGTTGAVAVIPKLANDFERRQAEHNIQLLLKGFDAWPYVPLSINDISLEDGGLFDVVGTYEGKVTGAPWSPPHKTHLEGTGIDINTDHFAPTLRTVRKQAGCTECGNPVAFIRFTLKTLGEKYGYWVPEATLHLEVGGGQAQTLRASAATADLSVSVFWDHPGMGLTVAPGQTLTYTIGVDNLMGDVAASGVVLTATLPPGLSLAAADPTPTRTDPLGQPVWELGTLGAFAFPSLVSLAAQVDSGVTPGSVLTVTAAATTPDAEARLDNNTDSFEVIVQPPGPDLVAGSSIGEAAMTVGQPVTFTLSVANEGNALASGTGLTLTLPLSVTLRSATPAPSSSGGSNVAWGLGNLAPGASQRVTVTVDLDGVLATTVPLDPQVEAGGLLTYTVQAGSPTPDIDPANNTQEVVKRVEYPGSDLSASLAAGGVGPDGSVAAGQEITYTVRYGNFGNQVAPTTVVTLSLGSGLSLISALPPPARTESSSEFPGGALGWDVGNVAVGASGVITARVRVASVPEDGSMVLATVGGGGREIAPLDNAVFERWLPGAGGGSGFRTYLPAVMRSFQPGW